MRQKTANMKKKKTNPVSKTNEKLPMVEEPMAFYKTLRVLPTLKNFSYHEFKKIADKTSFTQQEWSMLLHVSERTLQRYAKANGAFAPINAERALQISHVLDQGKVTFGSFENFNAWLRSNPEMLEGPLSLTSLTTAHGIQMVLTQLSRIQYGILA